MPRFTLHNIQAQYTREEREALDAAIKQSEPCNRAVCKCKRLENYTFGVTCTCYQIKQRSMEPIDCCACSLRSLMRDERFLAFALAWRRVVPWHAGDSAADAIPSLGTALLQMFRILPSTQSPPNPAQPYEDPWSEPSHGDCY